MSEASAWGSDIGSGLKAVADDLDVRGNEYSAKGIRMALARIAVLEAALTECAAPFVIGNQDGIDHEGIAREFNRRQRIAAKAIGQPCCTDKS